jgi:hypothetical protein
MSNGRSFLHVPRSLPDVQRSLPDVQRSLPNQQATFYLSHGQRLTNQRASSPSSRGFFIGNREAGKLRNCTILSKLLLGNGELASLAYGSLKLLYEI